MKNFDSLDLNQALKRALERMEFDTPTPIQAKAIPLALDGRDILGSAQTGTGKTAAFVIPLIEMMSRNPKGTALVLSPTRELSKQISDFTNKLLGFKNKIKTTLLIGGEPMGKQISQLKRRPRIIIGTPGRVNDHLNQGTLRLDECGFLVLDETDRMLDMGFSIQLDQILEYLPEERQTMMFSATLPKNIDKLSAKYLDAPKRIAIGSTISPVKNIKQDTVHLKKEDKNAELFRQLNERDGSIIVFVKTKRNADALARKLREQEFQAKAIHGDLSQRQREQVITKFRKKSYRILVATDVVARGLDIPHIEHVINFNLPMSPEDYIHRIGRTARAGAEGESLCLISPDEKKYWNAIERLMKTGETTKPKGKGSSSSRPKAKRKRRHRRSSKPRTGAPKAEKCAA